MRASHYPVLHSVSAPIWDTLLSSPRPARVLARFQNAVNFVIEDQVIALVTPDIGNGPFHAVVSTLPEGDLPREVRIRREGDALHVGPWALAMPTEPARWNPRPAWEALTLDPAALARLRTLAEAAARRDTAGSPFAALLLGDTPPALRDAASIAALLPVVPQIAGLGPGLTPSGDDFLAGVMLGLWTKGAGQMAEGEWQARIFEAAAPRTHRLSRAFLRAVRDGLASEPWHDLLHALSDSTRPLDPAVARVLAFGSSSGLDMVSGAWFILERKLLDNFAVSKSSSNVKINTKIMTPLKKIRKYIFLET